MAKFQTYPINDETTKSDIEGQFNGHNGNVYFIYSGATKLHDFIAELDLSDKINLRLKICSEKLFDYDVFVNGQIVRSLSALLEYVESENDEAVLDTDDKKEIADLTQQLIYLRLRLDLYLKDEKKNRDRYEKLSKVSSELYTKTKELREYLETFTVAEKD